MIFLYSYTIFCAFFLFALDRINNFCFIYKSDTKKILSNYFIFQAITFFTQIIAIYVKISNLSNYISFVSFLSRLLEIISWGYAAFLIDYFWLENRLKLKNKFLCYYYYPFRIIYISVKQHHEKFLYTSTYCRTYC